MMPETIDLTIEVFLPEKIKQDWIPLDGRSVPHLFQFTRYPLQDMLYDNHSNLSQLLHGEGVTSFQPHTLLQLGLPPSQLSDRYKAAIKAASLPIHSFTLVPTSGHPVRLPIWVLDYWREINRAMGYRRGWKTVLEWLKRFSGSESVGGICDQVMAGLSYFPWNGGNCSVHGMVSLLTDSYLSDFHIDYTLTKISRRHHDHYGVEVSNHHVFLPVFDLDSIVAAYKGGIRKARATDKRKQLLEVENQIILGHVYSVAGVLHLPNHWTSLVVTFNPPRILYGDSLGSSMPSDEACSFRRWICHMLDKSGRGIPESDISIYPLPTTVQQDPVSCGLFALNAISHHYLLQNSPLLQPDVLSLARCRLELASELLQEGAVSQFGYRTLPL
jgi:hypothetical protein